MINIDEIIRRLSANAAAMRALLESISPEQAQWQPDAHTWSMRQVIEHVCNEERLDFRQHLREMLSDPPIPWGQFRPEEYHAVESCAQGLADFLGERQSSLAWLRSLPVPNWEVTISASFGPENEIIVLRAGDVLLSWVEHDILHLRQMIELQHAWNENQAAPYSLRYAGGW
jgi:hypothetical protein